MMTDYTPLRWLKNGHRMEALKVDPKDQKLDNYLSFIWKGRAYGDTLGLIGLAGLIVGIVGGTLLLKKGVVD